MIATALGEDGHKEKRTPRNYKKSLPFVVGEARVRNNKTRVGKKKGKIKTLWRPHFKPGPTGEAEEGRARRGRKGPVETEKKGGKEETVQTPLRSRCHGSFSKVKAGTNDPTAVGNGTNPWATTRGQAGDAR